MSQSFNKTETFDEYATEKVDVIQSKLLGDYNTNGDYVINKKATNELIELKKIRQESYNNAIFCNAKTKNGRIINFEILFKKDSTNKLAVAELSVLEPVPKQGGRLINTLKTVIGKFTSEITPDFVDRALGKFNIVRKEDGGKDYQQEINDEYIIKRIMLLQFLDKLTADNYNIIYEDYFSQRLNLLKTTNNSYTKKVLAIFNDEYSKVSDYFLIDKKTNKVINYKAMSELLDKAFEDLNGVKDYRESEVNFKRTVLPIMGAFVAGAERLENSAQKTVLDTVPKRVKDELVEPLMDCKQVRESRQQQVVKETNTAMVSKEIKSSLKDISAKANILEGKMASSNLRGETSAEVSETDLTAQPFEKNELIENMEQKKQSENNKLLKDSFVGEGLDEDVDELQSNSGKLDKEDSVELENDTGVKKDGGESSYGYF